MQSIIQAERGTKCRNCYMRAEDQNSVVNLASDFVAENAEVQSESPLLSSSPRSLDGSYHWGLKLYPDYLPHAQGLLPVE